MLLGGRRFGAVGLLGVMGVEFVVGVDLGLAVVGL